jgi:hypothetical protein
MIMAITTTTTQPSPPPHYHHHHYTLVTLPAHWFQRTSISSSIKNSSEARKK